ncbi:looped-hinge helix DNA binding domain-containing protein, AbrB family [Sphingomonas gellani]|uniref:Looped-hinge helix DNA binding domain-containing protein, AbrB family n=1 Tax=Sphingomonas gellani TaxID=1166340 RepID=A0A1H8I8W6_9SPHN|nr:AbrB/MazE/SpoVT family DNA-binding domain-containing protein [Sphingomonas gellani]SEN64814.1 looped-hinge helix DNA binding domain-containing protein, AbrB family [Sphingomonas gellani]
MGVVRGKIIGGGRVALPADIRRAMGLSEGDTVHFELDGEELRVRSARTALKRIQDRLRPYGIETLRASDELIAERREAAARE